MKKNYLLIGLMAMGLTVSVSSCGDDDDENAPVNNEENVDEANVVGFGANFKKHTSKTSYTSAESCVEQIIDGAIDIANEVGEAKIGEPYNEFLTGDKTKALYSVESWYSWHSRDDYKNNIVSIANSFVNARIDDDLDTYDYTKHLSTSATPSLLSKCAQNDALRESAINVWNNIVAAWSAIDAIPQPFRNNIGSAETNKAIEACATLKNSLETFKQSISSLSEEDCQEIVNNFVDVVALPTYAELVAKNTALYNAVSKLQATPTDENFEAAAEAWLAARQPWETSEAFLFGPVSELGLDPNMDSWPLDQDGIENLLKSQDWAAFTWNGEYDEENEAIEQAQALRGFHTLEYLLFLNGEPRKVSDETYSQYASAWGNYAKNVALLLKEDATTLYNKWVKE
ncbi:MAG: peptidase M75 [Bacteroidaceae bacterium]|nr:peptidase M75 [Bacteroidaceae bacterium]